MSWNHIQKIMNDIGGSAVIVEEGAPRYVVVPVEVWERTVKSADDARDREESHPALGHDESLQQEATHNYPLEAYDDLELEYQESPLETLDTLETPSYPV